jgi:AGZA family xanthine/uracil permease-like MFS transporter
MLPGVAAWGALMAKAGLRAGNTPMTEALVPAFQRADVWIDGAFALEQGFIFTAMLLSAATVAVIERRFTLAAAWCLTAALLSALGLMHSYRWTPADTVLSLTPAWPWAIGYAAMAAIFAVAPWLTTRDDGAGHR